MGGFFGAALTRDAVSDVFFGTDYHSHLGTRRGGVAAYDEEIGLQRDIHNIENSPFRTRFQHIFDEMKGNSAIGCISDSDPQPLLVRSNLGTYAICIIGVINNADELINEYMASTGGHFGTRTGGVVNNTELVSALIGQKNSFTEGIKYAQSKIDGTASILILKDDGTIIAARDKVGRLPVLIGKGEYGFCVSFESFAYQKLGYEDYLELGPAEIVKITSNQVTRLSAPESKMRICSFLWSYYGYPPSKYEGVTVEYMRFKNGAIMAEYDKKVGNAKTVDYVGGVPDSGIPHAIGYSNATDIPYARAFIKYTPTWARSFTTPKQADRQKVAKMKQIPVHEFIKDKSLLFVDDSIVRGTQLRETVDFLYTHGAKEVHIRSACPPIMYGCKYLNFTRVTDDTELIARRKIIEIEGEKGLDYIDEYSSPDTERGKKLREAICKELHLASLEFQSLEGIIEAIGLPRENLCTYCWNGKE